MHRLCFKEEIYSVSLGIQIRLDICVCVCVIRFRLALFLGQFQNRPYGCEVLETFQKIFSLENLNHKIKLVGEFP
jgi:hypothetical protein